MEIESERLHDFLENTASDIMNAAAKDKCWFRTKHFVLVHGSCHSAKCWHKLQALLEARAYHKVTAIDLGASGMNPKQLSDISCISDYFDPLFSFFEALPKGERVILVGHGKGGLAIGAAMEKFPNKVAVGVFLTALMLGPKYTIVDFNNEVPVPAPAYLPDSAITYDDDDRFYSLLFGSNFLLNQLYSNSPKEDWTCGKLLARSYPYFDDERALKELTLTQKNYGSVKRVYIKACKDKWITPKMAKIFIHHTPPNEVCELPSADHMAMCSAPEDLACKLEKIAQKYN